MLSQDELLLSRVIYNSWCSNFYYDIYMLQDI